MEKVRNGHHFPISGDEFVFIRMILAVASRTTEEKKCMRLLCCCWYVVPKAKDFHFQFTDSFITCCHPQYSNHFDIDWISKNLLLSITIFVCPFHHRIQFLCSMKHTHTLYVERHITFECVFIMFVFAHHRQFHWLLYCFYRFDELMALFAAFAI